MGESATDLANLIEPHGIVHRQPASVWEDGLYLGNGDLAAMVFGTGFAPFRGGPLRYADGIGAGKVAEGLKGFNEERLAPCDLLEKLALQGGDFYSSVESMAETEESSHPPLPPEAD